MKINVFFSRVLTLILFGFLVVACSKDEAVNTETNSDTNLLLVEESKQASEADLATDGIFQMIETAYGEIEEDQGRNASLFPDCVTIIITSENDVTFVTLDFGFGCELQSGAIVSGMVHITYGPVQNGTRTINYSFENFVWNNKAVAGGGTIFRERNNAAGNPQSTIHLNLEISFLSGLIISIDGTRVREWVEGVGSGTWMDNVFHVTGNRTAVSNTGFTHYGIVTEVLRKEATCQFFVSGIIDITRNSTDAVLNFGDGECDNLATLTVNGVDHIIVLD